jgi:hypothetical protein
MHPFYRGTARAASEAMAHDTSERHRPPALPLHERSDEWLARILGRDLMHGVARGMLYLFIIGAVLATIAVLAV